MSNDYQIRALLGQLTNGQIRALAHHNGIDFWESRTIDELLRELHSLEVILGVDPLYR
jgi:hypothetical protein